MALAVTSSATPNRKRLYAPEVAGSTCGCIFALHTAASAITARASTFASAQRRGRLAAGDLIPKQDRLAAGAAVCVYGLLFSTAYVFQRMAPRLHALPIVGPALVHFAAARR